MTPHMTPVGPAAQLSIDADSAPLHHTADVAMPWLTSFLMHAGVGLVAAFLLYAVATPTTTPTTPPASFGDLWDTNSQLAGPADRPSLNFQEKYVEARQSLIPNTTTGVDTRGTAASLLNSSAGAGDLASRNSAFITTGIGGSTGLGHGPGLGDPGSLAIYGSHQIGSGPIFGKLNHESVVFLLDHSGSMMDTFDFLRTELKNRIEKFAPIQKFNIVMFSESAQTLGDEKLLNAYKKTKLDMSARIDALRAQGRNDDMLIPFQRGFEKAFAMKPTVIYFLTDGNFDPALVDVVAKLNQDHSVKISTIAYVNISPEAAKNLAKIAHDNGGKYRFVSEKDLGQ